MLDNTDAAIEINPARESNAAPEAGGFTDAYQRRRGALRQPDTTDFAILILDDGVACLDHRLRHRPRHVADVAGAADDFGFAGVRAQW